MTTLVIFATYLIVTVAIGLWASRRNDDSQEDYFLGGRDSSAFAMALSAVSSGRSAWLILGASGTAWATGLSSLWLFPGYILVEAWMFTSVGPRLRARSIELGALTVSEVLERAPLGPLGAGTSRLPARQLAGVVIVLFLLTYVSSQLVAGGKTLGIIFPEIDGRTVGLLITAGIILLYTWLGGYRAVVITDVVQACLMLTGIVLLPVLGLIHIGGFGALHDALRAIDPRLLDANPGGVAMIGGLCIGLGSLGNPHILVRHMALRDPRHARAALGYGTFWNIVMAAGALLLGLVGRAIYPEVAMLGEGGREVLFPVIAGDMSTEFLFSGFVGFLLATLFAAIMSTCDSQLLVIASSLLRDLKTKRTSTAGDGPAAAGGLRDSALATGGLRAGRLAVLSTLVLAVCLTFGKSVLIHNLVLLSWFALGLGLGPALLLLLYDKQTTARGVVAGMLTGTLGVVGVWWFFLREREAPVSWEAAPIFAASLAATWSLRARQRVK